MTEQIPGETVPVSEKLLLTPPRTSAVLQRRSRAAVARSNGGDRSILALLGLVLLLAGVGAALLGYGVFGTGRANRPLLDPMIVDWMRANPTPARVIAIAAGVVLAVLGLVWVSRSVRPERRPDLRVETVGDTTITVRSGAFGDAVATHALGLPGVGKARARMVGSDRAPALRVTLWVSDDCDVAAVLAALEEQVLASARDSLGLDAIPVAVRLELDNPPPAPRVT